jgi:PhoH-like ATPase
LVENSRLFVLDVNVLVHDPLAIFRFKEHDIFIPMVVLEELDAAKTGTSELARNARKVSRHLEDLIGAADRLGIEKGLPLPTVDNASAESLPSGRVFLEITTADAGAQSGELQKRDTLAATLDLRSRQLEKEITLVSRDINVRIKARIAGIATEDYYNDKAIDDVDLLYTGMHPLDDATRSKIRQLFSETARNSTRAHSVTTNLFVDICPNECLFHASDHEEFIIRGGDTGAVSLDRMEDYRLKEKAVWGVTARNREQNFALNLLMDPDVDFVSLIGVAGTGKTLLALAAGLAQSMESKRYLEIVVTRETISVGEDIGFLPGTEEEKMTPWMGALVDNLEILANTAEGGQWGRGATADLLHNRIKLRSLSFMRGRTFVNRYIIIDEAQNLTAKQMRTLVTRAGPGSKIVCLGNIGQIDTPYLSETTSGLTYAVDRFRSWAHSGHVTLTQGERSRLADYATTNL